MGMATGLGAWGASVARRLARALGGRALIEAEAQARTARDRLRAAIDAMPEGVVFLDAEGRYVLWNRRYAEIYHRSADLFAPGARLADTLRIGVARGDYPEAVGHEEQWLADRLAKLENPSGERHEQRLADGRWLMIEERQTDDGGIIGLRVDITQMKHQAQALEDALHHAEAANRAKGEFLADMSHELRTPLNGVIGLGEALAATRLTKAQHGLLSDILASARDLDRLVNGLLDYEAEHPLDAPPPAPVATPAPQDAPLRVLAADDNATNRKVIELMLGAAGAEVVSVEDGAAAVDAWRARPFDVILMDLRMPVMDGLEAIRAIREAEAGGPSARAPIIVISANTSPEDLAASQAAGADRHLGKPIQAESLFEAIAGVLPDETTPGT
jgi:CheY-like chemotaxis protein